jgi:uncharacterized membrane protein HdeD (DUF308 family)
MNVQLFLIRGAIAIAWAAAFAASWSGSLTTSITVLLVLYPVIDMVASIIDARGQHGSTRRLLALNAIASAATAVALGIAATVGVGAALGVFGVWAGVSGAAQLVVAIRRRRAFGWQLPMLLAGGFSTIGGVAFTIMALGPAPTLSPLILYTATGGLDFVIESWLLARRRRQARARTESDVPVRELSEYKLVNSV